MTCGRLKQSGPAPFPARSLPQAALIQATELAMTRLGRLVRPGLAALLKVLLTILVISGTASAGPDTALVTSLHGPVTILSNGSSSRTAQTGQRLERGQMIRTGPGGGAILTLPDNSVVEIFEDSRVQVNELLDEEGGWSFSLFLGRLAMKLKHLVSQDLVVSPSVVCGVRGTEFTVGVADDGTTIVSVNQGEVAVATADEEALGTEILLPSGREVEVAEGGRRPVPVPARDRTDQDWQAFRQERLEALLPTLAPKVAALGPKIDGDLKRLDRLAGLIEQKSQNVLADAEKIRTIGSQRRTGQRQLLANLIRDTAELFKLVRFFRFKVTRLTTAVVRARTLQENLPQLKAGLGDGYQEVSAGLAKVLDQEREIRTRVTGLVGQVRRALAVLKPVTDRLRQIKKNGGGTDSR